LTEIFLKKNQPKKYLKKLLKTIKSETEFDRVPTLAKNRKLVLSKSTADFRKPTFWLF
jgi:hypothetical protein